MWASGLTGDLGSTVFRHHDANTVFHDEPFNTIYFSHVMLSKDFHTHISEDKV